MKTFRDDEAKRARAEAGVRGGVNFPKTRRLMRMMMMMMIYIYILRFETRL